jgi:hypothetical protein
MLDKSVFIQGYSKIMALSWVDEDYKSRLLNDPRSVLAEAGIATPEGARISVVTLDASGEGSIQDQLALWEEGESTGVYQLHVPLRPANFDPDDVVLSDTQLEAVAGGVIACCCCTPCCCCGDGGGTVTQSQIAPPAN